ncbi:response regulator [Planomonospora sp. ID91781]|uniref:response regulator transcription factor n=1 Tax=Planomonospora sp. ID91781 TaxID=2738135 RepID=UPI0018C44E9D|nr:response regulator [Planomonospora sp. ID91781]MBG0823107.1 response regulator [Planomonospora sp. ID91781]
MPGALVVEDGPDHQNLPALLLEQAGWRVRAVADGAQALPTAREARPDLVVVDRRLPSLPGLPGTGVCRRLRAAPETAVLPLTSRVSDSVKDAQQEACRAGADDFILKPINHREFHARVLTLLKRPRPRMIPGPLPHRKRQLVGWPARTGLVGWRRRWCADLVGRRTSGGLRRARSRPAHTLAQLGEAPVDGDDVAGRLAVRLGGQHDAAAAGSAWGPSGPAGWRSARG